jgi:type I restriction enzyme S subunit
MSGKYQAYPEYKDSGVEWIGSIPAEWSMLKLTHAYDAIGSGTTPPTNEEEWYGGDIPWVTTGELRERVIYKTTKYITNGARSRFPTLRLYPEGSVAIAMYGATIGRLGIFGVQATTNQACCVLASSKKVDNQYVFYWLQAFRDDIVRLSSGGGQPNINQEKVASLKVSAPCKDQQHTIAAFLDHETARIDRLIEKQQRLIELLKEKRQAVISHAVTKGLDPNVPMKDSGVEWLGQVPEHWSVKSINYVLEAIGDLDHYMPESVDNGKPYLMTGDMEDFASCVDFHNCKQVSQEDYQRLSKKIRSSKGDVVMARYATIGTAMYVDVEADFLVSYSCVTIKPKHSDVSGLYLFYYFKSDAFIQAIGNQINTNTQGNVGVNDLKKVKVALPSLAEQLHTVKYFLNQ